MMQGFRDDPPFYQPAFEEAFRFIVDDYQVSPRQVAIFIPCAIRKPYSASPSHRLFRTIISSVFADDEIQIVVFGTCGVVPAELEHMYPYPHYQYMLGRCPDDRIRQDFLEIETDRLSIFLKKTRLCYRARVAYCIGIFREAMEQACRRSGTCPDLLLPSRQTIDRLSENDRSFPEGSLSMQEYLDEFRRGLETVRSTLLPPLTDPGEEGRASLRS